MVSVTVRAVDMQTMIPRLTEASRQQQQADSRPQVMQHNQTAVVQAQTERAQQAVFHKPQAEQGTVHRDGGNKGGSGGEGQPRQPRRQKAEAGREGPVEPGRGHRLDVKV